MGDLCVFLNTRIEGAGALSWIGDKGLAPFRYLFHGRNVRALPVQGTDELAMHHVASFHKDGVQNASATLRNFRSQSKDQTKFVLSAIFLIPGLVLSLFKLIAYLFSDVRKLHHLTKQHFTPINREIGLAELPVRSPRQLQAALRVEREKPLHQPTNALIIHGDGALEINEDPGVMALNPMKLILEGARIVHRPADFTRLDDAMAASGKWQSSPVRVIQGEDDGGIIAARVHHADAIDEALTADAPRRERLSCKRYHMVFTVPRPAVPAM